MDTKMDTKTKSNYRIEVSGLMFTESLNDESVKSKINGLDGIISMPKGENGIVFIDLPEENLEKIKDYFLVNGIKTLKTHKIGG